MKFHGLDFDFFLPKQLNFFIEDRAVLDLASHTGESSICISELGAKIVIGLEPRKQLVETANNKIKELEIDNVSFIVGDATNQNQMLDLLKGIDTVTTFGMFYHIADHHLLLKTICESSAKHLLLETEYGPESPNPSIDWCVENTQDVLHGFTIYPNTIAGSPNLQWIFQVLKIYNWQLVYYKSFYQPGRYQQDIRQRFIVGAVNLKYIDTSNLKHAPDNLWEWKIDPNKIVGKEFLAYEI